MKPIAVFFAIALIPAAVMTAHAKTVTTQGTSNEKSVSGVAGPPVAAQNSGPSQNPSQAGSSSARHPSKKALKKAKVSSPPPMHDPN
ncbi:MAG TPA: hypothetical protein VHC39_17175 [Rhizomicrobium sp.]|nr:hypothetical protein [Rhizomicrobium sp.]